MSLSLREALADYKPALPNGQARVLVVDDEPMVLSVLQETLAREGYKVTTAPSGAEALQIVKKEPPFSLVLTDERMPQLSGLDFLAQVKDIQPDATRILMTGVLELEIIINAINNGEIFRFVSKPWQPEELLVTIKNGVQRHDLLTRNAELHQEAIAMNSKLSELNRALEREVAREADQNRQLAALNHSLERKLHHSVDGDRS